MGTVLLEKGGRVKAGVIGAQRSDIDHGVGQNHTPGEKKKKRSISCRYWNKEAQPDMNFCFVLFLTLVNLKSVF